jgi:NADH:ubiquinone oxidoreductase subunit 6 (subunit J)
LTYVIVYIGAIAILFLFVVQLLDQNVTKIRSESAFYFKNSLPLALLLGLFLLIELGETLPSVSLAIESSQVLPGFH